MALEMLFEDRRFRKHIKDSVYEAKELGEGVCECCGRSVSALMEVSSKKICEDCCDRVLDIAEDYERVFTSDTTDDEVMLGLFESVKPFRESMQMKVEESSMVDEAYIFLDVQKFNDAMAKKNTDARGILKSYGLQAFSDSDDKLSDGKIFIGSKDLPNNRPGSKLNRFIDDFSCEFPNQKLLDKLVPDEDGYKANVTIRGGATPVQKPKPAISTDVKPKTTTTKVDKGVTTTQKAETVKTKSNIKVTGTVDKFTVQLASDLAMTFTKTKTVGSDDEYDVCVEGGATVPYPWMIDSKLDTLEKRGQAMIDNLLASLNLVFGALYDNGDAKYSVPKYDEDLFYFIFDKDSFDGNVISVAMYANGKIQKNRPELKAEDLQSKVMLDKKLTYWIDYQMNRVYPSMYTKALEPKLSIGQCSTEYRSMASTQNKADLGMIDFRTSIANIDIEWQTIGANLKDDNSARSAMLEAIYAQMEKLISGWDKLKSKKPMNNFTDSWEIEVKSVGTDGVIVGLNFDENDFLDNGNITFMCSIIDNHSGIEMPKKLEKVTISKLYSIDLIAQKYAKEAYAKYFKESDMAKTMTQSAIDKMGNRSKKLAFLSKVADKMVNNTFKHDGSIKIDIRDWDDIDVEITTFDVNTETGKLNKVVFTIADTEGVTGARDGKEFYEILRKNSYLDSAKADTSSKDPEVEFEFSGKGIDKFAEMVCLDILESMMFEAFGVTIVNESTGRKTLFV